MKYAVEIVDATFDAITAQARYIAVDCQASLNTQRWLEQVWVIGFHHGSRLPRLQELPDGGIEKAAGLQLCQNVLGMGSRLGRRGGRENGETGAGQASLTGGGAAAVEIEHDPCGGPSGREQHGQPAGKG